MVAKCLCKREARGSESAEGTKDWNNKDWNETLVKKETQAKACGQPLGPGKKARGWVLPLSPQRKPATDTLTVPSETDFRFRTSITIREYIGILLSH